MLTELTNITEETGTQRTEDCTVIEVHGFLRILKSYKGKNEKFSKHVYSSSSSINFKRSSTTDSELKSLRSKRLPSFDYISNEQEILRKASSSGTQEDSSENVKESTIIGNKKEAFAIQSIKKQGLAQKKNLLAKSSSETTPVLSAKSATDTKRAELISSKKTSIKVDVIRAKLGNLPIKSAIPLKKSILVKPTPPIKSVNRIDKKRDDIRRVPQKKTIVHQSAISKSRHNASSSDDMPIKSSDLMKGPNSTVIAKMSESHGKKTTPEDIRSSTSVLQVSQKNRNSLKVASIKHVARRETEQKAFQKKSSPLKHSFNLSRRKSMEAASTLQKLSAKPEIIFCDSAISAAVKKKSSPSWKSREHTIKNEFAGRPKKKLPLFKQPNSLLQTKDFWRQMIKKKFDASLKNYQPSVKLIKAQEASQVGKKSSLDIISDLDIQQLDSAEIISRHSDSLSMHDMEPDHVEHSHRESTKAQPQAALSEFIQLPPRFIPVEPQISKLIDDCLAYNQPSISYTPQHVDQFPHEIYHCPTLPQHTVMYCQAPKFNLSEAIKNSVQNVTNSIERYENQIRDEKDSLSSSSNISNVIISSQENFSTGESATVPPPCVSSCFGACLRCPSKQ